jgi:hypothetical protein
MRRLQRRPLALIVHGDVDSRTNQGGARSRTEVRRERTTPSRAKRPSQAQSTPAVGAVRTITAALTAALAACEGGGHDGIPGDKTLGELSSEDQAALCEEYGQVLRTNADAVAEISCTLSGRAQGSGCAAARDACLADASADPNAGGLDVDQALEGCNSGVSASCPDVTVGEARACFKALAASVKALAASVTCSASGVPEPSAPEACTSLGDRCPELASLGG